MERAKNGFENLATGRGPAPRIAPFKAIEAVAAQIVTGIEGLAVESHGCAVPCADASVFLHGGSSRGNGETASGKSADLE